MTDSIGSPVVEGTVRTLLESAGIAPYLDDVISVDDLRTFKPDPEVYGYLTRRIGVSPGETWLVSSNAWDVIGVKAAGLRTVWLKRCPDAVYDPLDIEPDMIRTDLHEFATSLGIVDERRHKHATSDLLSSYRILILIALLYVADNAWVIRICRIW